MENESENLNSSTEDVVEVEDTDSSSGETDKETEEFTAREKQYFARMKKLEGQLKELKSTKQEVKPSGFGLDVKGYLKASGIKSNEFDFVQEQLGKFNGDIDSLLENEYFQAKLEKHRELAKTADAIPTGKRSGGVPTDSVDYWMAKPMEDVPANMRRAVVNAKLTQEKNKGVFYNS